MYRYEWKQIRIYHIVKNKLLYCTPSTDNQEHTTVSEEKKIPNISYYGYNRDNMLMIWWYVLSVMIIKYNIPSAIPKCLIFGIKLYKNYSILDEWNIQDI